MRTIPSGNEALTVANDYGIDVAFQDANGSRYNVTEGHIILDRTLSHMKASLNFIYEMAHVLNHIQGNTGDRFLSTRDEYIADMIWDEATATAKAIYAKRELRFTNIEMIAIAAILEDSYWIAFGNANHDVWASGGGDGDVSPKAATTEAEVELKRKKAGLARLVKAFERGEVISASTGEPYSIYYGRM